MGERETILLIEGSVGVRRATRGLLEDFGHSVVATAGSLGDVAEVLQSPQQFRLAIISGYLLDTPGQGEVAASMVRTARPDVIVIAHSADQQTFGDFNVDKRDLNYPEVLLDTVKGIPNPV